LGVAPTKNTLAPGLFHESQKSVFCTYSERCCCDHENRAVWPGVTFRDVGAHLDVMPRHVAYLLSMRREGFDADVPWLRAVPDSGTLQTPKHGDDDEIQANLLRDEGIVIGQGGSIMNFAAHVCNVAGLPHAVAKQKRPADTPQSKRRK
jgi:methylated-DNA-protein-cysteine methyltransferase related protein